MYWTLFYAAAFAGLGVVCWPSPRWQRLLLGTLALLGRLGVLSTLAGLGATAIWPEAIPSSLPILVQATAEQNHLDRPTCSLLLAVLVASASIPVLAGLDFAHSLADDRGISRALRAALRILERYEPDIAPYALPSSLPAGVYRSPSKPRNDRRRRVGDLAAD